MKQTSRITKLRVVFDGYARTTTGVSLNDIRMVGPVLQQDLISIINRFRTHKIALTSNIVKMYRQLLVDESQTSLQRILWRENSTDTLSAYELQTVTYGAVSASFLAIRSLRQLTLEDSSNHPISSKIALRDFYVDDLVTGASTIEQANTLREEISSMLSKGGFEFRKWSSNYSSSTNDSVAIDYDNISFNKDININTSNDVLEFSIPNYEIHTRTIKRFILTCMAQIFDLLDLIRPIITTAKLIMQQLWQLKIPWDESLPTSVYTSWQQFRLQLQNLNSRFRIG